MTRTLSTLITSLLLPIAVAAVPAKAADTEIRKPDRETQFAEVRKETRELLSTLREYGSDQRDEAVETATRALFELDNRIRDLEIRIDRRWEDMNSAARENMRDTLRALQRQRIELAEWYGGLKTDSGAAWNKLKRGFSQAFDDLNRGWEQALRQFDAETGSDDAS